MKDQTRARQGRVYPVCTCCPSGRRAVRKGARAVLRSQWVGGCRGGGVSLVASAGWCALPAGTSGGPQRGASGPPLAAGWRVWRCEVSPAASAGWACCPPGRRAVRKGARAVLRSQRVGGCGGARCLRRLQRDGPAARRDVGRSVKGRERSSARSGLESAEVGVSLVASARWCLLPAGTSGGPPESQGCPRGRRWRGTIV